VSGPVIATLLDMGWIGEAFDVSTSTSWTHVDHRLPELLDVVWQYDPLLDGWRDGHRWLDLRIGDA
jgi:hypothetical protein